MDTHVRSLWVVVLAVAVSACTVTVDQNTLTLGSGLFALILAIGLPWLNARNQRAQNELQDARAATERKQSLEDRQLAAQQAIDDRKLAALEAADVKAEVLKASQRMEGVEKLVDGKMKEVVEIASNLAGVKATVLEREKQEGLTAARAEGALEEVTRRGVDDANSAKAVAAILSPAAEKKLDDIKDKTDELTFSEPGEVDAGKKRGAKGDPGPQGPPGAPAPAPDTERTTGEPIPPGSLAP